MLKRELLLVTTLEMFERVPEENIDMSGYIHGCGSPSCWLGHLLTMPSFLQHNQKIRLSQVHNKQIMNLGKAIRPVFNLDHDQYWYLFGQEYSGAYKDICKRLLEVLNQPGPEVEPEIENLDQEMQRLLPLPESNPCLIL